MTGAIVQFDHIDLGCADSYAYGPPHEAWARRRAAGPVVRDGSASLGVRFRSVTGWTAVRDVLSRDEDFCSRFGMVLGYGPETPDPAGQKMISAADAPYHGQLRTLMHEFFTPRWAREAGEAMAAALHGRLKPYLSGAPFDFARDVAGHLPMEAACLILGLPEHDRADLYALATSTLSGQDPDCALDYGMLNTSAAHAQLLAYFLRLARARRRESAQDLVCALARAREPRRLSDQEIAFNCVGVLIAATETTRLALAGATAMLAARPDLWTVLGGGEDQLRAAGEEILRWTSPATHVLRTARRDTVLAGHEIAEGELVVAWLAAANRDDRAFDSPGEFDPARVPNRHVTFGFGPHHCIGATVARVELITTLRMLLSEASGMELLGPPVYLRSIHTSGYKYVPLRLLPR